MRDVSQKDLKDRVLLEHDEDECVDFVKSCHNCQTHVNLNHVPLSELYSMTSPWPFLV